MAGKTEEKKTATRKPTSLKKDRLVKDWEEAVGKIQELQERWNKNDELSKQIQTAQIQVEALFTAEKRLAVYLEQALTEMGVDVGAMAQELLASGAPVPTKEPDTEE